MSSEGTGTFSAQVVTVSTGGAVGTRIDRSGPALADGLRILGLAVGEVTIIPDDVLRIQQTVLRFCDFEPVSLLAFTGGTGPTPEDLTPAALAPLLTRRYEGMEMAIHQDAREAVPRAILSRLIVGARGRTVVIALPGATAAVEDAIETLGPLLPHLLRLTSGQADLH